MNLWLIPVLPLAGAVVNGLLGRRFSRTLVSAIALASTALSFLSALVVTARFWGLSPDQIPVVERYTTWIRTGNFSVPFAFQVDQLTIVMLLVVTGVGFLIHIYSVGYMAHEGGYYRFFSYLNLFMFFMLVLVLANNYLLMFVGWEGVGLASYLLIGFYFPRDSAANAGMKAFITNRVGDFGFIVALFLLIKHFNSLEYVQVFAQISRFPVEHSAGLLTAIALLMMVGAAGKSAQIPLYVWLPDAMEGPTPVSALIHAATMVTAGVYMVTRSNAIFLRSPDALLVVAIIGALTAIFAATIGLTQFDIKRVLAYSTISQLGYMFLACGVAAFSAGVFHLMTHAFFKALLFLSAGSVIHGIGGEQDMRAMGGLRKYMPVTFWVMLIATLAIAGFPPLAGFWSKDEILWQSFNPPYGHWALWLIGFITALMTSFYMFRLIFMTFWGEYRGPEGLAHVERGAPDPGTVARAEHADHTHQVPIGGSHTVAHAPTQGTKTGHDDHGHHGDPHESPWLMLAPLVILAVLSTIGGFVGIGNRFEHFLSPVISHVTDAGHAGDTAETTGEPHNTPVSDTANEGEHEKSTEYTLMALSVLAAFTGAGLAFLFYVRRPEIPDRITNSLGSVYRAVLNKYYVDEFYGATIIKPLVNGSRALLWRGIDAHMIDGTINDTAEATQDVSRAVGHMQSGNIRSYAGWVAIGAGAILVYVIWVGVK